MNTENQQQNIDIISTELVKLFEPDEHSLIKSVFLTAQTNYNLSVDESATVLSSYIRAISERWLSEINQFKKQKPRGNSEQRK